MTNIVPTPEPFPEAPSTWTPEAVITYVVALSMFTVGLLTQLGVTLPHGVSNEVQTWSGLAAQAVALLTAVTNAIHSKNVQVKYYEARLKYSSQ